MDETSAARPRAATAPNDRPEVPIAASTPNIEAAIASSALPDCAAALHCIVDSSLDGFWQLDTGGRLRMVNDTYCRLSGYTREELLAMEIGDLDALETVAETRARIDQIIRQGRTQFATVHRRKDGSTWDVEVSVTYLDREPGSFFVFLRDISARKEAERALRAAEQRFRDLVETTDGIVWQADARTFNFTFVSRKAERLLGFPTEDWLQPGFWVSCLHAEDRDWAPAFCAAATSRLEPHDFEYRFIARDGRTVWLHDIVTVVAENGAPRWLRGIMVDVTARKEMEAQIHRMAFYDALTGLPNRRLLADRIVQAVAACKRDDCHGALMFLDLDNFKPLNDVHGHAAGDLLLAEVARRIARCVREIDTVARFGGDEFVVVLRDLHGSLEVAREDALIRAEKIRAAVAAPCVLPLPGQDGALLPIEHRCSASIGIVMFTGDQIGADDIVRRADATMYRAKESGRNCIRVFGSD